MPAAERLLDRPLELDPGYTGGRKHTPILYE